MSYTQIISKMIEKASRKDIGTALKILAIGVFFLLLGACLSLILYGSVDIDVTTESITEEHPAQPK